MIDDAVVEVFASESCVAGGCEDLENSVFHREEGYIKGATAEVVDEDETFGSKLGQWRLASRNKGMEGQSNNTMSIPYASDAAVGSLTTRITFNPAMRPASLVACRCLSLK